MTERETFRFGDKIGSGGFGVVSNATRASDGSPFAVKHLSEALLMNEEAVKRFRREVRIQRALTHPNVLPVVAANLAATPPWFVMPIAAQTLQDLGRVGLDPPEVDRLFEAVLAGVVYAHEQDVLHRDIKPENVMISGDGQPQLSDFGLGKNLLGPSLDTTKTLVGIGSFPYVSPEQMVDLGRADARSDVYSLGKLLQFLLTGEVPVRSIKSAAVDRRYQYFIERCCAEEPNDRYQTARDAGDAFRQVTEGSASPVALGDTARDLADRWEATGGLRYVRDLLKLLEASSDDRELLRRFVPRLDRDAIAYAFNEHAGTLRHVIDAYDGHVSGQLPYEYCDVIAGLYERVYDATDDLEFRAMLLARLLSIGRLHNRYPVGTVVARILMNAAETSEVMMVADTLKRRPDDTRWYADNPTLRGGASLAPAIDEALFGGENAL